MKCTNTSSNHSSQHNQHHRCHRNHHRSCHHHHHHHCHHHYRHPQHHHHHDHDSLFTPPLAPLCPRHAPTCFQITTSAQYLRSRQPQAQIIQVIRKPLPPNPLAELLGSGTIAMDRISSSLAAVVPFPWLRGGSAPPSEREGAGFSVLTGETQPPAGGLGSPLLKASMDSALGRDTMIDK